MSRGKVPFLIGIIAIILGVVALQFSQGKAAFRYGVVALGLFGLVMVLIALKREKKF